MELRTPLNIDLSEHVIIFIEIVIPTVALSIHRKILKNLFVVFSIVIIK